MEKAAAEPAVDLAKEHGPYYYAHAAKAWEVPEDAKTISGEGLTHTGQGPRRLDGAAATAGDAPDDASMEGLRQELARLRARLVDNRVRRPEAVPLKKYAFADGEETCKIYIEFAAGELRARRMLCGNQPVRRVRVDGVEDDAAIQDERAVNFDFRTESHLLIM